MSSADSVCLAKLALCFQGRSPHYYGDSSQSDSRPALKREGEIKSVCVCVFKHLILYLFYCVCKVSPSGPNLIIPPPPPRDLDLIIWWQCEQHESHGIWSFQVRFRPFSHVVLIQIQIRVWTGMQHASGFNVTFTLLHVCAWEKIMNKNKSSLRHAEL